MEEHVYKVVKNAENNNILRLNAIFTDEFIHLTILQNSNALNAMVNFFQNIFHIICRNVFQVDKNDIEKLSNGLNKTLDEYCTELKEYIANVPDNIKFSLKETEFIIYYFVENSIKIKYFSYKLNQVFLVKFRYKIDLTYFFSDKLH